MRDKNRKLLIEVRNKIARLYDKRNEIDREITKLKELDYKIYMRL